MVTTTTHSLDLGRCLNDAMDVYKKNFLTFVVAAVLFDLLVICSLLILTGPLWGGIVIMTLRAMSEPGKEAKLGDMFGGFQYFGPLVGMFFLTVIPILVGYTALLLPGLILSALWTFSPYLIIEHKMGVIDSLRMSWRIVCRRGLWINTALAFVTFALMVVPTVIPYVGWIAGWFIAPIAWCMLTSAYNQQVREQTDLAEFGPRGFEVPMANVAPAGS